MIKLGPAAALELTLEAKSQFEYLEVHCLCFGSREGAASCNLFALVELAGVEADKLAERESEKTNQIQ